jgi:hypothetical protein
MPIDELMMNGATETDKQVHVGTRMLVDNMAEGISFKREVLNFQDLKSPILGEPLMRQLVNDDTEGCDKII